MQFLDQLPLAEIITNFGQSSQDSNAENVQPGNYRILNEGSQRCLSYSSRSATAAGTPTASSPTVMGWACGVPGVDDDLHQIWTIRATPVSTSTKTNLSAPQTSVTSTSALQSSTPSPPPIATAPVTPASIPSSASPASQLISDREVKSPAPTTINPTVAGQVKTLNTLGAFKRLVVIESLEFFTEAGAGHPFRLDLQELPTPKTEAIVPSGRTSIPNGVKPPTQPVFQVAHAISTATAPPLVVTPPIAPRVDSYVRQLIVSPQAGSTSSFQFLRTDIRNKFFIFSPATGMFIGHVPGTVTSSTTQKSISTPPEQALDGSPVQATDLKKYLHDVESFLRNQKGAGALNMMARIQAELQFWLWEVRNEDFGPPKGPYRLVSSQNILALIQSGSPPHKAKDLQTVPIAPATSSQIWNIEPIQKPANATVTYSITAFQDSVPLLAQSSSVKRPFRLIYVPIKKPVSGQPTKPPSPTPLVPSQYLLYNDENSTFLTLQGSASRSSQTSSTGGFSIIEFALSDGQSSIFDNDTQYTLPLVDNPLLALLYRDVGKFRKGYGSLIWNALPNAWAPVDGLYTIQSSTISKFIDIPATTFTSPSPISLTPAYQYPSVGSEFWRISSEVDRDIGIIYQTIVNYRSGYVIDNSSGVLVGRRLGATKNDKWRFSGQTTDSTTFAIMDYATTSQGILADPSGKIAAFAPTTDGQLLWKLTAVDLGIADGAYFVRDLVSRKYLTRNSDKKQPEPLLLTDSPTSWTISSIAGTVSKRISSTSDAGCFIYAPDPDSSWKNLSADEIFAITNYSQSIPLTDPKSQFRVDMNTKTGEFSIMSQSLQKTMVVSISTDDEDTLVISFKFESPAFKGWELIPAVSTDRQWSIPSWLVKYRNSTTVPNLPDGVYRISNSQTKTCLALGRHDGDLGALGVNLTGNLKEAATDQLWYVRRDRDPRINSQLQTYTITSLKYSLVLQERLINVGQPAEGLQIWAEPSGTGIESVTASQKWMIWKQAALTWCIQCVGGSGGLLDLGDDNQPLTKPQINSVPSVTQVWRLDRAQPELSGGYYRIQNMYTQSYMSVKDKTAVTSSYASYGKSFSDWRLIGLSNGYYRIQSVGSLQYICSTTIGEGKSKLTMASTIDVNQLSGCWMLLPSGKGILIQNAQTFTNLTTPHGSANDGLVQELLPGSKVKDVIPWQVFAFERVDSPSPAFDDVNSDKISGGIYTITNVSSGQQLGWASDAITIGTAVVCKKPGTPSCLWTILPSGTGYYSLSLSNFPLGLGQPTPSQSQPFPGIGVSGLDSSTWKLLKFDTGNYRLINKENGLLLLQDSTGNVSQGPDDNITSNQNEWKLDLIPPSIPSNPQALPKSSDREIQPTNGLYIFSNSSSSIVMSMSGPNAPLTFALRDLEPFSINSRFQVWIVEQDRNNWYIIKSFPFGLSLGCSADANPKSLLAVDDGSPTYRWKFIQDSTTTTLRLVPKLHPNLVLALDSNAASTLAPYSGSSLQRWQMIRSTGTPTDTKLAQGTYILSTYMPPNVTGLQAQATATHQASLTDQAYAKNLDKIAASALTLSTALIDSYTPPPLPAGIDTKAVESELESSDLRDAPAVTAIAAWIYGKMCAAKAVVSPALVLSEVLGLVGDVLVDFCNISSPTTSTAAIASRKIGDIVSQAPLLVDAAPASVQIGMISAGQALISQLNTYIQTLPGPSSSITDPNAPLTITQADSTGILSMTPLASQAISQYWLIESAADGISFTISHLTSGQYLTYDKSSATPGHQGKVILQGSKAYTWQITTQRLGGYSIVSSVDANIAICSLVGTLDITGEQFVLDGQTGYLRQRWSLRRAGYYLQNQGANNLHRVVAMDSTGNGVHLTAFRPFGQNKLINNVRSDAYCIWHLALYNGKYRFFNECSRTALRDAGEHLIVSPDASLSDSDLWQLAKNGDDIWMQVQNGSKKWMALDNATGSTLCVQDPGGKERWRGWQLISVATTERGLLINLPRFALQPRAPIDQSSLISVDVLNPLGTIAQRQYMPDNSYQRFRSYTYANNSLYINEATASVLKSDGTTTDLSSVDDQATWFTSDKSGNISCLDSTNTPIFTSTISGTGDLSSSNLSLRIQIGKVGDISSRQVLSVDSNGALISEPWDRLSNVQVWSYLDWDKGRFIIHVQTLKTLALTGNTVTLLPAGSYTEAAIWRLVTISSSQVGVNGFLPLQSSMNSTLPQYLSLTDTNTLLPISQPNFGVRFINDSSWFSFTTRLSMLTNFIKSRSAVFVHAKGSPLPISVDAYLSACSVTSHSASNLPALSATSEPLPITPGDWVLNYTGPVSDGSTATAYIIVRDADEAVYINYTDFMIYLLYPPSTSHAGGWQHITMRFSNYSNLLESVFFPSLGWIYNLDMNWSSTFSPGGVANPLSVIKRSNNTTKLHVYVGPDLVPVPNFPQGTTNAQIIDDSNWGLSLDSGTKVTLLKADMVKDDEAGSRPVMPTWGSWGGSWVVGTGSSNVSPQARFP